MCTSAIALPADGRLTDGLYDYCVGPCGYVVAYPHDGWQLFGQPVMDRHNATEHPARHAEILLSRSMSAD